jgi:serine/threonine protein kinase/tetratricopeptide (TPR) repeat protein
MVLDEKAIFVAALALPDAQEREAHLQAACAGQPELLVRLRELLAAHEESQGPLDRRPAVLAASAETASREGPDGVLGPYKLLEQIGEGGMGTVWMAQQTAPVKRLVAVKLIKAGMDSRQVVARFEAERQALALMDHPNIAKVLDAGTTGAQGLQSLGLERPYFVMELVKGVPITRYCDQHRLTPRQRLELFLPVCQAVQHAHQKGVIHRDLKPSNVLVALYDGRPVPKVIDFGVAKAAGQTLTEKTLVTGFGSIVGTLEYMSPEQAELNQLDIDTRSDVYSLGVLLYELLTGSPPFTRKGVEGGGVLEMLQRIREQEPTRPSTKLSTAEGLPTLAANRGTAPAKLTKLIRGDLDWIVLKALEKDRNRRYQAASALAADVEGYLRDEPVQACPPSAGYRLRKFVRRNRGPVLAAGMCTLLLAGGVLATAWQAWRATQAQHLAQDQETRARAERDKAQAHFELAQDAVNKYLAAVTLNPKLREKDFFQLRKELLETALPFYEKFARENSDDPEMEAARGRAYHRLAEVRHALGELEAAAADYREMRAVFARLVEAFPGEPAYRSELARSQTNLGIALAHLGQRREAEAAYRAAAPLLEHLAGECPDVPAYQRDLALTQTNLGNLLRELGRRREAEAAQRAALEVWGRLAVGFPDTPVYRQHLAVSHNNLGNLLVDLGQTKEAEAAYRAALGLRQRLTVECPGVPAYRHQLATSHENLGLLLARLGQLGSAEPAYRAALDLLERLAGEFPGVPEYRKDLGRSHGHLGNLLRGLKKHAEAEAAFRAAVKIQKQLAADYPGVPAHCQELARTHNNRGIVLGKLKQYAEEEAAYREALKGFEGLARDFPRVPAYRQDLAKSYNNLGLWLVERRRLGEAEAAHREALTIRERLTADFPDVPEYTAELGNSYKNFAALLMEQGEHQAGLAWCARAIGVLEPVWRKEPRMVSVRRSLRDTHQCRAEALDRMHRHGEAVSDWDEAVKLTDRSARAEFERAWARSRVLDVLTSDPAWQLLWGWRRF